MQVKQVNGKEIFERLRGSIDLGDQIYVVDRNKGDPFERLIAIILSQNTNDLNAKRALENLKKSIGLDPQKIVNAGLDAIKEAIKVAGLYNQKAKRIINIAKLILEGLNLNDIINSDTEEARKHLLKIAGLGPKTADVFLAIYGHKTIGIDTHIARISKRMGFVNEKAKYEEIREKLMEIFKDLDYDLVHRYMIAHGRLYCKARKPRCKECPIREFCDYGKNLNEN